MASSIIKKDNYFKRLEPSFFSALALDLLGDVDREFTVAKPEKPFLFTSLLLCALLWLPLAAAAADFEALKSTNLGHDPQLIKKKFFNDDLEEVRLLLKEKSFAELSELPDSVLISLYSFSENGPQTSAGSPYSQSLEAPPDKTRWFNIEKASEALRALNDIEEAASEIRQNRVPWIKTNSPIKWAMTVTPTVGAAAIAYQITDSANAAASWALLSLSLSWFAPKPSVHYQNDAKIKSGLKQLEAIINSYSSEKSSHMPSTAEFRSTFRQILQRLSSQNLPGEESDYTFSFFPGFTRFKPTPHKLKLFDAYAKHSSSQMLASSASMSLIQADANLVKTLLEKISEIGPMDRRELVRQTQDSVKQIYERATAIRLTEEAEVEERRKASLAQSQSVLIDSEREEQPKSSEPESLIRNTSAEMFPSIRVKRPALPFPENKLILDARKALAKPKGNLVLVGMSGVGKTEFIKHFISQVHFGSFPEISKDTDFVEVNPLTLIGGTRYVGDLEARVRSLIERARGGKVVLVIDRFENLRGGGSGESSKRDVIDLLMPYVSDGSIRVLATGDRVGFHRVFENDETVMRAFSLVDLQEPKDEVLLEKIDNYVKQRTPLQLGQEELKYLAYLSEQFDPIGAQPAKSIRLIEELKTDLSLKNFDFKTPLTKALIDPIALSFYKVPPHEFDPSLRQPHFASFQDDFTSRVAGLDRVRDAIFQNYRRALTGTAEPNKPRGRVLLSGPRGLGKSTIPAAFAQAAGLPYKKVKMSEYGPTSHRSVDDLLREIFSLIRSNPFAVINFDEFEKARLDIQQGLLDFLENARISVPTKRAGDGASGQFVTANTRGLSVFLTTNAGKDYINQTAPEDFKQEDFEEALIQDGISEFVLDRLSGNIWPVHPPQTPDEFKKVLRPNLQRILNEFSANDRVVYSLADEEAFLDRVTAEFFTSESSFRPAVTHMSNQVGDAISDLKFQTPHLPSPCVLQLKAMKQAP